MKSAFPLPSGKLASWADEDDDDNATLFPLTPSKIDPIESDTRPDDTREEIEKVITPQYQTRRENRTYQSIELPRDPPYKIFVGNLPSDVQEDDLVQLFGTKARFHIPMPRKNAMVRGRVAFAEFENREDAAKALELNHHEMQRNRLEIKVAEDRFDSGGRGRGRGRRQQSAGRVNTTSHRGDRGSDRFELPQDTPKERPKLHILPRSIEKDLTGERTTANKNIFGEAKARDETAFLARQQSQAADSSSLKIRKRSIAKPNELQTGFDSEIVSRLDNTTLEGAQSRKPQPRKLDGRGRGGRGRGSGRLNNEGGERDRDRGRGRGRHSSGEGVRVYRPRRPSQASQPDDAVSPSSATSSISKNKEQKKSLKTAPGNKGKQKPGYNEKNIFNLLGASDSDAF